jgi:hypothetical protein
MYTDRICQKIICKSLLIVILNEVKDLSTLLRFSHPPAGGARDSSLSLGMTNHGI